MCLEFTFTHRSMSVDLRCPLLRSLLTISFMRVSWSGLSAEVGVRIVGLRASKTTGSLRFSPFAFVLLEPVGIAI